MVCDLVQHDVSDLLAKKFLVLSVKPFQRPTVDGDLVREHAAVVDASARERNTLVEAEQRLPFRWLVFDRDLDVRDPLTKIRRERVECILDKPLEVWSGVARRRVRAITAYGKTT
jgi:hypothetical protein